LYGRSAVAAAEDFSRALTVTQDYGHDVMWLHIARVRAGQSDKGEFADNVARLDAQKWPAPVAALYLGKASPEAVRAAAAQGDDAARRAQGCDADFYIGALELQAGARAAAKKLFQSAAAQCPPSHVEGWAAKVELKRLGP
jgi:lipoprotein NlpI